MLSADLPKSLVLGLFGPELVFSAPETSETRKAPCSLLEISRQSPAVDTEGLPGVTPEVIGDNVETARRL